LRSWIGLGLGVFQVIGLAFSGIFGGTQHFGFQRIIDSTTQRCKLFAASHNLFDNGTKTFDFWSVSFDKLFRCGLCVHLVVFVNPALLIFKNGFTKNTKDTRRARCEMHPPLSPGYRRISRLEKTKPDPWGSGLFSKFY
jgi:hypothetical protein